MSDVDVTSLLAALRIPVVRRAGEAFWCCCPSPEHTERTPSWFIRERPGDRFHGSFHCFGCSFSGWPVQLVCKMLGIGQVEAFAWLRSMPRVEQPLPKRVEVVTAAAQCVLAAPEEVVFAPLLEWPSRYREYLEGREVSPIQTDAWGLGYIPKSSESPLADRVWIPAYDANGRLLSYTARAIGPVRRRYREPFAKEGASKAAIFGELRWPSLSNERVLVVEGAFNGLAAERVSPGLPIAALMGSSIDPQQVLKLTRFKTVAIATDPDKAGNKARSQLRAALARYVRLTDVMLPAGQDLDSLPAEQRAALLGLVLSA